MTLTSFNKKFSIELAHIYIEQIVAVVDESGSYETGGILIGNYTSDLTTAIITKISGPPTDSKRGRTWFNRGTKGLNTLIKQYWRKSQYYLGEWHFHPNSEPNPSRQDILQMKEIACSKKYNCPEPILIIIGGALGKFSIAAYIINKAGELIRLGSTQKI